MKRIALVAALALAAAPSFAGVVYRYHRETEGHPLMTLDGEIAAEGPNLKMTVSHGDALFKSGSVVLSRDGGKTIAVFDPASKTYFEMPFQGSSGMGDVLRSSGVKVSVENPSFHFDDAGDGGSIEGFPTRKLIMDASSDVKTDAGGEIMSAKVSSRTEIWMTDKLDAAAGNLMQQRGVVTGILGLDEVAAQASKSLEGRFPLKQVMTVHMTANGHEVITTSTQTVSNVRQAPLDASAFAAPVGYTKVDNPIEAMKKR
jgi:hypothetical protein